MILIFGWKTFAWLNIINNILKSNTKNRDSFLENNAPNSFNFLNKLE